MGGDEGRDEKESEQGEHEPILHGIEPAKRILDVLLSDMEDRLVVGEKVVEGPDEKQDEDGKEEPSEPLEVVALQILVGFALAKIEFAREHEEERVGCEKSHLADGVHEEDGRGRRIHHDKRVDRHHEHHGDDAHHVVCVESVARHGWPFVGDSLSDLALYNAMRIGRSRSRRRLIREATLTIGAFVHAA